MSQFILFAADPTTQLRKLYSEDPVTVEEVLVIASRGYFWGLHWKEVFKPARAWLQSVYTNEQEELLSRAWFDGFDQGIKENPMIRFLNTQAYTCYEIINNK
jgi:hypothetical protein